MKVFLIRHTSVNVPKDTCYGCTDVPVADTFDEEARLTREALRGITFDRVFCSPLTRARLLAQACGYHNPVIDKRLCEMNMGDWEMRRFDEISDPNLQLWYDDYLNRPATNGESFRMLYARVESFLNDLRKEDCRQAAVFSHGGVLLCAGLYAGIYSESNIFDNLTPYGGLIRIDI